MIRLETERHRSGCLTQGQKWILVALSWRFTSQQLSAALSLGVFYPGK